MKLVLSLLFVLAATGAASAQSGGTIAFGDHTFPLTEPSCHKPHDRMYELTAYGSAVHRAEPLNGGPQLRNPALSDFAPCDQKVALLKVTRSAWAIDDTGAEIEVHVDKRRLWPIAVSGATTIVYAIDIGHIALPTEVLAPYDN